MTFLKRRKPPKFGTRPPDRIICPGHLKWTRGFECLIQGRISCDGPTKGQKHECWGPIDAHHVITRGAGGGDEQVVPLCRGAHSLLDSPGWSSALFDRAYKADMAAEAAKLWQRSNHGRRYRQEHQA